MGNDYVTVYDKNHDADDLISFTSMNTSRTIDFVNKTNYVSRLLGYGFTMKDINKVKVMFYSTGQHYYEGNEIYLGFDDGTATLTMGKSYGIARRIGPNTVKVIYLKMNDTAYINMPERKIVEETRYVFLPDKRKVTYEKRNLRPIEINSIKNYLLNEMGQESRNLLK